MNEFVLNGFFDELEKLGYTLKSSIPEPMKMPRINSPTNPTNKVTRTLTKNPKTPAGAAVAAPMASVPVANVPIAS